MAQALRQARDLRVFVEAAVQDPSHGGVAYARYATELCRSIRFVLSKRGIGAGGPSYGAGEDPAAFEAKAAAVRAAEAACASFSDEELGPDRVAELLRRATASHDALQPFAEELRLSMQSADAPMRRAALKALVKADDPLLLSLAMPRALRVPDGAEGYTYRIDGASVAASDLPAFEAALLAVPCRLGAFCDPRRPDILGACLDSGDCVADRVAFVRSRLEPQQRVYFDAMLPRLESALREHRTEFFSP